MLVFVLFAKVIVVKVVYCLSGSCYAVLSLCLPFCCLQSLALGLVGLGFGLGPSSFLFSPLSVGFLALVSCFCLLFCW